MTDRSSGASRAGSGRTSTDSWLSAAPALLLAFAFFLEGAKNPLAFSYWAIAALVYALLIFWKMSPRLTQGIALGPLAFLILLGVSFYCSHDRSVSFFWTLQLATFSLLWIALILAVGPATQRGLGPVLVLACLVSAWATVVQLYSRINPSGLLPVNHNFNAAWLAVSAIFLIGYALEQPRRRRMLWAIPGLIAALLVLIGPSRGALIALWIGALALLRHRYPLRRLVAGSLLLFAMIALFSGPWMLNRFHLMTEEGMRLDRPRIWTVALQATADQPWTGYGAGNFELGYQRHAFPLLDEAVHYGRSTPFAHNDYLETAAELGIPAAALLFYGLFVWFRRSSRGPAMAGCLTLLTASLFNPIARMPLLLYMTILLAALSWRHSGSPAGKISSSLLRAVRVILPAATLCLILLLAVNAVRASWEMHERWDRLVESWHGDAAAWHMLGFQQSSPREGARMQAQAVLHSPRQVFYREAWANALEAAGDPENHKLAAWNYREALNLAPSRAVDVLALARILYQEGDAETAIKYFEQARAIEPAYWEADLWIARCLYHLGKVRQAMATLEALPRRRADYLASHPIPGGTLSPYERTILAYDEETVQREIRIFATRRASM